MLWNMKIMVIPIVAGAFGMISKGLEKKLRQLEIQGRIKIIQTTVLLSLVRILKRVLQTYSDNNENPFAKIINIFIQKKCKKCNFYWSRFLL